MRTIALFMILSWPVCIWAEYTATELFIIGWGEGTDEFIAYEGHEVDPGTPEDSTDDYFDGGSGPATAFVDKHENIIITNPQRSQWKGFNSDGDLIFDFSRYSKGYKEWMWSGDLYEIYIDDFKQVYTITSWPKPFVFKIDYESVAIDTLRLVKGIPEGALCALNWTYEGNIMFFWDDLGWITYEKGEIILGGAWGVKLANGRYYSANFIASDLVIINSIIDPDVWGYGSKIDSAFINLEVENAVWVELLNSMEPTHLYLRVGYFIDFSFYEIWKYDLGYNLIDKIIPPAEEPYYWSANPNPFITADGDIYEFRTRVDGLHVIRWSKK